MRHSNIIVRLIFLHLLLTILAVNSCRSARTENYNDCLLENLKGTTNTLSVNEIKKSCARQFPKSVPLDDIDLIVHVVNSGELMLNSHYKAVHKKYYSDISYDDYLQKVFEKKDRTKYKDISFDEFLKLIEYRQKE